MEAAPALAVLLLCAAVGLSEGRNLPLEPRCLCATVNKALSRKILIQISTAKKYDPRPHCSKTEVVVTLKDGNAFCLDPATKFTNYLLVAANRKSRNIPL